jgi:hypothetical protein
MKCLGSKLVAGICAAACVAAGAVAQEPREYVARYTATPPVIDGIETTPDEWADSAAGGDQWLLLSNSNPDLTNNRFNLLWDDAGLYVRHQVDYNAWQYVGVDNWAPTYEQLNYYFDPNTDGEANANTGVFETTVDGYQLAFNLPLGLSQLTPTDQSVGRYSEAHVDALFGNQGAPFLHFAGMQLVQNTSVEDSFGYTEYFVPWNNFDATNPEHAINPEIDDLGLFHPDAPEDGEEWYFNVTRIQSSGLIPAWSSPSGASFMADRPHGILRFDGQPNSNTCDLNGDDACDAGDIDALSIAIFSSSTAPQFDIDRNGTIDEVDRTMYVEVVLNTWIGDSNLDGEFSTRDLVEVFSVGGYEDDIPGNAGWIAGDWSGDLDFTSRDFVEALSRGGFEVGPRAAKAGAVSAVPEPSALVLLVSAMLTLFGRQRDGRRLAGHRAAFGAALGAAFGVEEPSQR